MRRRSEVVAALANFFVVQLLPSGIVGVLAIGSSLGIGAKANEVTVHPPGWTPVIPIAVTAFQLGLVMLPFALLAAWRTWVHAKRWLEFGTSGWEGVGEAAACGLATLLVMLLPGIPRAPDSSPAVHRGVWRVCIDPRAAHRIVAALNGGHSAQVGKGE
jgi:hypothetical protein